MAKYECLAKTNPELIDEWHPTKNGDLLPTEVTQKSGRLVWWLGKCGHEWQSKVYIRTSGHGCPYCSNIKVLPGFNDLATKNPNLAKEWHPNKNGDLKPDMFASTSNKKVWWLGVCGHEWQTTINSRHFGNGCPVCANQQVLSGYNDLATKNPNLAKEWHQTKNGEISPTMVSPKSSKRAWWMCEKGHEWQARVADRASGKGCPYCANVKVLPKYNDLETKEPNIVHEWHPTKNGNLKPDMITDGSRKAVWWLCEKGHEWQATIKDRVDGTGCPICKGKQILRGENDLATLYPNIAKEWHPTKNGELTPYMIAPKSGKKVWWMCEKGHEWQALVSARTNGIAYKIGSLLGVSTARIDIGFYQGRVGSMSYFVCEDKEFLKEGIWFISAKYPQYNAEIMRDEKDGRYYCLDHLFNAVPNVLSNRIWIEMMLFDFIIGNSDRHQSNWALLIKAIYEKELSIKIKWCPLYDNGSSLCCYVKDKDLADLLDKDKNRFEALVDSKSRSLIRIDGSKKGKPTHREVVRHLLKNYSVTKEIARSFLEKLTKETINALLDQYNEDILGKSKKELICRYLNRKVDILKELLKEAETNDLQ